MRRPLHTVRASLPAGHTAAELWDAYYAGREFDPRDHKGPLFRGPAHCSFHGPAEELWYFGPVDSPDDTKRYAVAVRVHVEGLRVHLFDLRHVPVSLAAGVLAERAAQERPTGQHADGYATAIRFLVDLARWNRLDSALDMAAIEDELVCLSLAR